MNKHSALHQILNVMALSDPQNAKRLLETISAEDPDAFKWYLRVDSPNRGDARVLITEKLAERDLNEAIDFVAKYDEGTHGNMLNGLSLALPKDDPIALHEALTEIQEHAKYEALIAQLGGIMRSSDPKVTVDSLLNLETSKVRQDLLGEVIGQWAETDLSATQDLLQGFPQDERDAWAQEALNRLDRFAPIDQIIGFVETLEIDQLPSSFVEEIGKRHPEAMANMIEKLPEGPARKESHQVYGRTLAESQGEDGLDWVTHVSPLDYSEAVKGFAEGWSNYDTAAAAEWLALEPRGDARDQGVAALASHLVRSDSEAVFAWGSTIEEASLRMESLAKVIPRWSKVDSEATQAAIKAAEIPASEKEALRALIPSLP
ncbi:MAG: hypothetical protein ACI8T1_000792 [Verrucomicrobiales bacterium]